MKLEEMKIVVTGAASGMGRYFALALAEGGAKVAACDINPEGLESLRAEAEGLAGELRTYEVNVANEESVVELFNQAWADFGGLNGLVNNAGLFRDGLLVKKDDYGLRKMSLKNWQLVLDVDLTGPFLCTRELAARIVEAGGAPSVIINISSISRAGNMGQSNYSAAKAGLVADTVLWAKELARYGIRVAAIAPGFVDTPILQGMRPDALNKMLSGVPLRRAGAPAEIFAGVKFIIECDYFTGRCVDIDGGLRL
ncbi:MAG: SDR family oxidoreductase [Myxococcales bacterium]|nr:SDR family oxidoreductase [Myxococcales bacterium]MCB9544339.1 SDR family oxidoreductase [Myxococcales bacterium]